MSQHAVHLVPERTPFVGRARELQTLRTLVEGSSRLLTVTGPSGMGKTRVALELARGDEVARLGSVHLLDLAGCHSPADLRGAVLRQPWLGQGPGVDLADALRDRGPTLLLLDGVEPAAASLGQIFGDWLDQCSELTLLATSLLPLGIRGEICFELGPLEEPDAAALYLARVRDVSADRAFSSEELQEVRELVRRLDRLPLAIELAAARVQVLPPRVLLRRLDDRLELLRSGARGRHASLAGALSLTFNLLDQREQRVLAESSVFAGGFTLEAAESVLGGDHLLDTLEDLRRKALLQLEGDRFSMYESVRTFAERQLRDPDQRLQLEQRHASHFARQGCIHSDRMDGPGARESMRWLADERENLLAAHRRAFAAWPGLAARAGLSLAALLTQGGARSFEEEILDGMVQAARRDGDPRLLAQALWSRARAYKRQGNVRAASEDIDEGLAIAAAAGDRLREGYLLAESGAVRGISGAPHAAADLDRALAIATEQSELLLQGVALLILGTLEESKGHLDACISRMEAALSIFRAGGHLRYRGVALLNLGAMASHLGRTSAAKQALEEACSIFEGLENLASLTYATHNLGSLALATGRLADAERHLLEVLSLERRCGNRLLRAASTGGLGQLALERGAWREAERRLAQATAHLQEMGALRQWAAFLPFHAATIALLGGVDEARRELGQARAAFEGEAASGGNAHMLDLLEGVVLLAEARLVVQGLRPGDAQALQAAAATRLEAARELPQRTVEGFFIARRLLESELAKRSQPVPVVEPAEPEPPPTDDGAALVIGPEGAWFSLGGGSPVDLRRRTAIRKMLCGLVENRLVAPGVGTSADDLAAVGWPGEKILPHAAATRVWSGIRTLRTLGLAPVLIRHADGYLLDPSVRIERAAPQSVCEG